MDLNTGRRHQKFRTRQALLVAARQVLENQGTLSVPAAADAAMISRATAYRYFSTNEALIREALLDADWKNPTEVIGTAQDVHERVARVGRYLIEFTKQHEVAHRLFLAKSLEAWVAALGKPKAPLRGARRLPMFEMALEPLRPVLRADVFDTLLKSLASASGIEAYIALRDVCGLDEDETDRISAAVLAAILDRYMP